MSDIIDDSLSDAGIRSYDGASTVSTIYPDDSASAVAGLNPHPREILPSSGGLQSENSVITFDSVGACCERSALPHLTVHFMLFVVDLTHPSS